MSGQDMGKMPGQVKLEQNYKRHFVRTLSFKCESLVIHYLKEHVFSKYTKGLRM